MNRIYLTVILLGAALPPAAAQRLDGCPERPDPFAGTIVPGIEGVDRGLQYSGVALTREPLLTALADSRPEVRSLAGVKLGKIGQKADIAPLVRAWVAEEDKCSKTILSFALGRLLRRFASDASQHPGFQPSVTPFQACTASEPALVSLRVEQTKEQYYAGPSLKISARNHTSATLPFLFSRSPAELFSVTVLDPTGARAKFAKGKERMFEPVHDLAQLIGNGPTFLPLPPQEDVSWIWRVGEEFDMSAPGTYRVSLGGRVPYLDTTVCSNTAEVTVEKQP